MHGDRRHVSGAVALVQVDQGWDRSARVGLPVPGRETGRPPGTCGAALPVSDGGRATALDFVARVRGARAARAAEPGPRLPADAAEPSVTASAVAGKCGTPAGVGAGELRRPLEPAQQRGSLVDERRKVRRDGRGASLVGAHGRGSAGLAGREGAMMVRRQT